MNRLLAALSFAVFLLIPASAQLNARSWDPTPMAEANDYLNIQHIKDGGRQIIMVFWAAPPLISLDLDGAAQAREILDNYLMIGLAHVVVGNNGLIQGAATDSPIVKTASGDVLNILSENDIPPVPMAVLTVFRTSFVKNIGALGEQVVWRVYDGSKAKACSEGGLIVSYNGEDYDYRTPVPGC